MNLPPPPPSALFVAWRRRRGERWTVVGWGRTETEAYQKLHDVMALDRTGDFESMVLKRGERP